MCGSRYALVVEQPLLWHTTQPVEPTTLASASVTWAKIEGLSSMPPTDLVFNMVKKPPSIRASTTGLVSLRMVLCSSAAEAISGRRSRASCSCGWTVGILCLLLPDGMFPVDYRRAGRRGQAATGHGLRARVGVA